MNKKKVSTKCQVCYGKGVVPSDETFTIAGQTRQFIIACDSCHGRGRETRWIEDRESTRVLSVFKKAALQLGK